MPVLFSKEDEDLDTDLKVMTKKTPANHQRERKAPATATARSARAERRTQESARDMALPSAVGHDFQHKRASNRARHHYLLSETSAATAMLRAQSTCPVALLLKRQRDDCGPRINRRLTNPERFISRASAD